MTVRTEVPPTAGGVRPRLVTVVPGRAERNPAREARRRRLTASVLGAGTPILVLLLWQVAASQAWIDTRFFPAPTQILEEARGMVESGMLASDLWATLRALLIGYAAGLVVGTAVGTLLATSETVRAALEPTLSAISTVPKLAILPLLLLIFGLGETPKIILISLGVFFIIWVSVFEGITDLPPTYSEAASIFAISGLARWRHITLPGILPNLFTGMRIALTMSVLVAVGTEFVNGDRGVGYRIWHSWSLFQAGQMYVGIVVVALLGFVLTWAIKALSRWAAPWAPRQAGRSTH